MHTSLIIWQDRCAFWWHNFKKYEGDFIGDCPRLPKAEASLINTDTLNYDMFQIVVLINWTEYVQRRNRYINWCACSVVYVRFGQDWLSQQLLSQRGWPKINWQEQSTSNGLQLFLFFRSTTPIKIIKKKCRIFRHA